MAAAFRVRRHAALGVCLAALALAAVAAVLAGSAATALTEARAPGTVRLEDAVAAAAAAVGALVAGWLATGTAVSVCGLLAGRRGPSRLVPAGLHRLVAVALGVALAGVTVPASAQASAPTTVASASAGVRVDALAHPVQPSQPGQASQPVDPGGSSAPLAAEAVDPGWTPPAPPPPVRRAAPADPLVVATPRAGMSGEEGVAVRRGDTLWDIAARHLPAGSPDADIAAAWPRWHAANATVIGDDPDLLRPGQLLRVPTDAG